MRPRHRSAAKAIAIGCAIAAFLAFFKYSTDHPTPRSIASHVARDALSRRVPHLSDAELNVLKRQAEAQRTQRQWVTEKVDDRWVHLHHLDRAGRAQLRVGYDDGYFILSDVHHLLIGNGSAPIEAAHRLHGMAAGYRAEVAVLACCEGGDARVTLAVRRHAPGLPRGGWAEASDTDLDLPAGRLVFRSTGGVSDVVTVPSGRYRLRVSGVAANEGEQDRERFRLELWPRRANMPSAVLRAASWR